MVLGAALAQANTINLSTGLDSFDTLIILGNTPDAHWTVDQPSGPIAPAKVVALGDPGSAIPIWATNGPGSSWITIDPNSSGNGSVIPYTYYRTFNLSAADVATASISGVWGIDDSGEVRLNGYLLSSLVNDYSASTPFSALAGSGKFLAGTNTLTITMTSSDDFLEAVRLEGSLNTGSVPDSGTTLALLGGTLTGLGALRRKFRK